MVGTEFSGFVYWFERSVINTMTQSCFIRPVCVREFFTTIFREFGASPYFQFERKRTYPNITDRKLIFPSSVGQRT